MNKEKRGEEEREMKVKMEMEIKMKEEKESSFFSIIHLHARSFSNISFCFLKYQFIAYFVKLFILFSHLFPHMTSLNVFHFSLFALLSK